MAAEKVISELNELTTVDENADWVPVVDVSDTSASEFGTTKKALVEQFIGPKGDAATVDAGTTTTGDPGTDASVVNSGTTSAAVFDFTIPRGDKGEQGIQGLKGDKGDKGDTGAQGIQGVQGVQGTKGDKGDKGDTGAAATADAGTTTTLAAGASATVVNSGTTSAAVFDFGIPQGIKGDKGDKGDAGTNGTDGLDINWLGAYDNSTNYVINDAVSYSGSSYICKLASTGNVPTNTTYWDLMAQKGADGAGAGDVLGPATNTDSYLPQWDGANSKTLKNGLAVPAGGLAGITALNTKADRSFAVAMAVAL